MANTVLILSQYFHPDVAGTGQILTELAVGLRQKGMRVGVINAQPTYTAAPRAPRREVHEGVEVERLPLPRFNRRRHVGRIASAIVFCSLVLTRLIFSRNRDPLLVVTNPPVLPFIALLLSKVRRQPYVCLVHDIYPDAAIRLGYLRERGLITRIWERLNVLTYTNADTIIVLGQCMAETLRRKTPAWRLPPIRVIHNWADPDFIVPREKEANWVSARFGTRDKLTVLYAGNMGLFHDIETLIEAARRVQGRTDIEFLFIGGGGKQHMLVESVRQGNLTNVQILPYQPREDLPFTLTCGDFSAVTLVRGMEGLSVPAKLYTALAAGQAILAVVGEGSDVADIIKESRCGLRVDQGDADGLVRGLLRCLEQPALLAQMKANARRCFEERFTMGQAVQQYHEIFSRLGSSRRLSPRTEAWAAEERAREHEGARENAWAEERGREHEAARDKA